MAEPKEPQGSKPTIADDVRAMYDDFRLGKARLLKWLDNQVNRGELLKAYVEAYGETPQETLDRAGTGSSPAKPHSGAQKEFVFTTEMSQAMGNDEFLALAPPVQKQLLDKLNTLLKGAEASYWVRWCYTRDKIMEAYHRKFGMEPRHTAGYVNPKRVRSNSFNQEFQKTAKKDPKILDLLDDGTKKLSTNIEKVVPALCRLLDNPKFSTMARGVLVDQLGGMGTVDERMALRRAMRKHVETVYAKDPDKKKALLAKIPSD